MKPEIKISVRAYAKKLQVDEKAIRNAIRDGRIKKGYDTKTRKITESIANKEWGFLHVNPKPQRGVSVAKVVEKLNKKPAEKPAAIPLKKKKEEAEPDDNSNDVLETDFSYTDLISKIKLHPALQYSEVVRRKEILAAADHRMKLEEANGSLLRKDEINKALFAAGDQLKKELLNLPNRITEDIRNAPNKVEAMNIFNIELNQLLTNISQLALP